MRRKIIKGFSPAKGRITHGIRPLIDPDDDDPYFLYVFQCGPYMKVGITADLDKRKAGIETHNPFKIRRRLWRRFPRKHVRFVESFVHKELRERHHRGEWFTASIEEIRKAIYKATKELPQREADQDDFITRALERERSERESLRKSRVVALMEAEDAIITIC